MIKNLTAWIVVLGFCASAAAQPNKNSNDMTAGPRKHMSTIVLGGVAGAILGLSTLSFYGRPQDKLSMVPMGAAVGIIIGTMYTTFKAATEPRDFYSLREAQPELWSLTEMPRDAQAASATPGASWSFTF